MKQSRTRVASVPDDPSAAKRDGRLDGTCAARPLRELVTTFARPEIVEVIEDDDSDTESDGSVVYADHDMCRQL